MCAAVLLVFAVAAGWLLLRLYGQGTDADKVRLEGFRTIGTIVLGAGGAFALLLAARRQQTAEHDLTTKRHDLILREQANNDVRHDAAERRITDLYLKAAEQLGSDKAPVRLAGLYALDRLAQGDPPQRQTIVNVISAYLRMPYELPSSTPGISADKDLQVEHRSQVQEREVRVTAQRILTGHFDPHHGDGSRFWEDINLDLSGALLIDFALQDCQIDSSRFASARFTGDTLFLGVNFTGDTRFDKATFEGDAWFVEANFTDKVRFDKATFCGDVRFDEASFTGTTIFRETAFNRDARFNQTAFTGSAVFSNATFARDANFDSASFVEDAWLPGVTFTRHAYFSGATFTGDAWFSRVNFNSYTTFDGATFNGDIKFDDATLAGVPYSPGQLQPDYLLDD